MTQRELTQKCRRDNSLSFFSLKDAKMRLRADRFFSNVPYTRMVGALTQLTAIPDRTKEPSSEGLQNNQVDSEKANPHSNICMDDILRETIISTHAFADRHNPLFHDVDACDLQHLVSFLFNVVNTEIPIKARQLTSFILSHRDDKFQSPQCQIP